MKWPKISTNSVKSCFFAGRPNKALDEGWSSPQELELSPHSGLYLLVLIKGATKEAAKYFYNKKKQEIYQSQNKKKCKQRLCNVDICFIPNKHALKNKILV